jgi:hypothetical protein
MVFMGFMGFRPLKWCTVESIEKRDTLAWHIKDTYIVCKYVKKTVFGVGFMVFTFEVVHGGVDRETRHVGVAYKRHIYCM